jgi:hypothetical protein
VIILFFQRFATFFAILTGMIAHRVALPDDSPWWLDLAVGLPITVGVYLLLHKDGVTTNRPKPSKGTPSR